MVRLDAEAVAASAAEELTRTRAQRLSYVDISQIPMKLMLLSAFLGYFE